MHRYPLHDGPVVPVLVTPAMRKLEAFLETDLDDDYDARPTKRPCAEAHDDHDHDDHDDDHHDDDRHDDDESGTEHAPPPEPPAWRDRDAVVASGVGLHAQMLADLECEAEARPQSGLLQKTFCEPWTFGAERYAFWTRVRGCAALLAATTDRAERLTAQCTADLADIDERYPIGARLPGKRVVSARAHARMRKNAFQRHASSTAALLPEPMRTDQWKALRYYPQVVRTAEDAQAFLDPQATPDELRLAVTHAGLDAFLVRWPHVLRARPDLAAVLVAHFLTTAEDAAGAHVAALPVLVDARCAPTPETKARCADAFMKHLRAAERVGDDATCAALVPPAARARLVAALTDPVQAHIELAANLLRLLPSGLLVPHAEAFGDAVGAFAHRLGGAKATASTDRLFLLLEDLVKRAHDPKHVDMVEAHARAMGVATTTGDAAAQVCAV